MKSAQQTDSTTPVYHALPYRTDALLKIFASFAHQPWAMLLHSGFAAHRHSRFDIMVADPRVTLATHGATTNIVRQGETQLSHDDPFTLVQRQMDALGLAPSANPDAPFLGGALGLFGYDLGRRVERLPACAQQDLSLPDMAVGIYDWALIADHRRRTLTLVTYGDPLPRLAWMSTPPASAPERPFKLCAPWRANMTRRQYGEKFRRIQQHLLAGDCYQVNLTQRFTAPYQGSEW